MMQLVVSVACLLMSPHGADAHAYLLEPKSRNLVMHVEGQQICPHCGQAGGPDNVAKKANYSWPSAKAPGSHGLCGDPFQGESNTDLNEEEHLKYSGTVQQTYVAGDVVSFVVAVSAHHKGHFEFRICDKPLNSMLASYEDGQSCLNKWVLERVPPEDSYDDCVVNDERGDCQPIDDKNPGRWYLPPAAMGVTIAGDHWSDDAAQGLAGFDGAMPGGSIAYHMKYRIPSSLSCTHCTLQWYWVSGNTCMYDEHYFTYFQHIKSLGWNAAAWQPHSVESWANCDNSCCHSGTSDSYKFGEEFWNCADIAVLASGSPTPAPPTAPDPTPEPETEEGSEPAPEPASEPESEPASEPESEPQSEPEPATANDWDARRLKMTHYWDCSGQGCDSTVLQPWNEDKYVSPPGYGPQDPDDFGGPVYGEKMWLTGAASDAFADLLGASDPCCGTDSGRGGCGKCLLIQNPDAENAEWTAVIMKKNRCPPWTNGCSASDPHFDVAAPGFDDLRYSTANVCAIRGGSGFENQTQSAALGRWYESCANTAECQHLCDKLPTQFVAGCKLFAAWGWTRGDPPSVKFRAVQCPPAFVSHVGSLFDKDGVVPPQVHPTPAPTDQQTPSPTQSQQRTPAPTKSPTISPTVSPATPAPAGNGGSSAASCRNPECGCPPYDAASWCSDAGTSYGVWCSKSKTNCEDWCSGIFCEASLSQLGAKRATVKKHEFLGVRGTSMMSLESKVQHSETHIEEQDEL